MICHGSLMYMVGLSFTEEKGGEMDWGKGMLGKGTRRGGEKRGKGKV